ncbi:hypothetical protein PF005_g3935 [Phytophthora fragariae]|uniref:Uncharacterized protein n=1 Tax=Phytophthora fragariae TaxID=53985 RepID=A0A6A3Z2E3_9STRA|nr:hypothetical protein PF003_g6382 [Phytophthora fragariae]KAE8925713.1 hypothetical protein PF009_g24085 [Phytophthora fragariae]KAE9009309.1 hypothetical protein PF011_g10331 [Phytophthora fragariae]KAE9079274.1 hypothetical protein PF010_g22809 [Phytophthora fragariae]KAE9080672.1 hypothetical protein PF007_g22956 [Phytophthora fragariae]
MICVVIGLTCSASRSHSLTTSAASKITLPPNRQLQRPKSPKPKRAKKGIRMGVSAVQTNAATSVEIKPVSIRRNSFCIWPSSHARAPMTIIHTCSLTRLMHISNRRHSSHFIQESSVCRLC